MHWFLGQKVQIIMASLYFFFYCKIWKDEYFNLKLSIELYIPLFIVIAIN